MDSRDILSSETLIQLFQNTSQKCPSINSTSKLIDSENSELEENQIRVYLDQMKQFIQKPLVDRINNLSEAEWIPQLKCSRVVKKVGKKWNQFGHSFMGNDVLYPEEAAYLLEINDLRLVDNGVPMSVQKAFALLLSNETGCTLEEYRVYAYFVSTGYRVFRHESISIETDKQDNNEKEESVSQHPTNMNRSNTANPDPSVFVSKQAVGRHEPSEHKSKMLVRVSTRCSSAFDVKFTDENITKFDNLKPFIDRLYGQREDECKMSDNDDKDNIELKTNTLMAANDMSEDIVAIASVEHDENQKENNSVNEEYSSSKDEDDEERGIDENKKTKIVQSSNDAINDFGKENSDANLKSKRVNDSSSSREEEETSKETKMVQRNDVDKEKIITVTGSSSSSSSEEEDTDSDDSEAIVTKDVKRQSVTDKRDEEIVTLSSSDESISEIQDVPTIKKEIITLSSEDSSEEEEEDNVGTNEKTTIKAEEFIPFNNKSSSGSDDANEQLSFKRKQFGGNDRKRFGGANKTSDENQNKYYMNRTAIKRAFHRQQGKGFNRRRDRFKKRFKQGMNTNQVNINQILNENLESDLLSEQADQHLNEDQANSYTNRRTQMERNILNKQRRLSLQNKQHVLKRETVEDEGNEANETSQNTDDPFQNNNVQNAQEFSNMNELNQASNEFGVENIESTVSNFVQNAVQQLTHAMYRNRCQPNLNVSQLDTNLFNSNISQTAATSQVLPNVVSYQQFSHPYPSRSSFNQFSMPQPPPSLLGLPMSQASNNFSSPHQSVPANQLNLDVNQFNPNLSSNPPALANTVTQLSQLKNILDGINANIQNSVDGLYKMNRFQRRQYYHRPYNPNFRRRYQNNRNFNNRSENDPTCGSDSNRNENNRHHNNRNFNNRFEPDKTCGNDNNRNDNRIQNNGNMNNRYENGPTSEHDNYRNDTRFQNGWNYKHRNQSGYPENRNIDSDYNQEWRNQNNGVFMRQNQFQNGRPFGNRFHANNEFDQRNTNNFHQRFRHQNRFENNMNRQSCDNSLENNRTNQFSLNSDWMRDKPDVVNPERTNENSGVKQETQETSEDETSDEETSSEEEEDDDKQKVKQSIGTSEEMVKVKNETNVNGRVKVESSSTSESEIESDDQEIEESIFLDVCGQNTRNVEEERRKESEDSVKKIVTIVDESSLARRTHIRFQYSSDDDNDESGNIAKKNVEVKVEDNAPLTDLAVYDSDQELERENEKILKFFSHVISEEEKNDFLNNYPNRPYDLIKHIHSTMLTKARIKLINRKINKLRGEDRNMLKFILKKEQTRLKKIRYNVRKRIMRKRMWGETKMAMQIDEHEANSKETLSKGIDDDDDDLNGEASESDFRCLLRDLNARKSDAEEKTNVVTCLTNNVSKETVDGLKIDESVSKIVPTHDEKINIASSDNRSTTSEVNETLSNIVCNNVHSKQLNKSSEETNINTLKQDEKVKESLNENVKVTKFISADEDREVIGMSNNESNNVICDNVNILGIGKQATPLIEKNAIKISKENKKTMETVDIEVTKSNNTNVERTSDVEMLNSENDHRFSDKDLRKQLNLSNEEIKTSESDMLTLIKGRQDCSNYSSVFNALNIFSTPDQTEQPKLLNTQQPLKISFDVYCSSKQFAKTRRSTPNYRIVVVRPEEELPSPDQMLELKSRCSDSVPLIFAIVLPQSITLYQYADVFVPVLIEQLSD